MKETADIIVAFEQAVAENKRAALATVVKVEGSSYRKPGARMLVTEDGMLTGAISGGCLERDALRKALAAIMQQENKLVVYDSMDEDDAQFGVQLGCNGIVHILFEPIDPAEKNNPVALLQDLLKTRSDTVLVTMFSPQHSFHPGTCLLFREKELQTSLPAMLTEKLISAAADALKEKYSSLNIYDYEAEELQAFVEFIPPPVKLVIAGAGNDVMPLTEMAALLGWEIIIADGRPAQATFKRFPKATQVLVLKADELLSTINSDRYTAFLLMTHNYNYDIALLKELRDVHCGYIGILGPKKKTERMIAELNSDGIEFSPAQCELIHGPTGLNIGAETAEEIALSVVAEIRAFLSRRDGTSLKSFTQPIHGRTAIDQ